MSFSKDVRKELLELKMWDNNSSLNQDEQLARLLIREAFIKIFLFIIRQGKTNYFDFFIFQKDNYVPSKKTSDAC